MQRIHLLPGASARRLEPGGLAAGAARSRVRPPSAAFALVAEDMAKAEAVLTDIVGDTIEPVDGAGVSWGSQAECPRCSKAELPPANATTNATYASTQCITIAIIVILRPITKGMSGVPQRVR